MNKGAGNGEPGARSASHRDKDVRRSDFRRQTVTRKFAFSSQAQDSWELGAWSLEPGARHIEVETSDGQTRDIRLSRASSAFSAKSNMVHNAGITFSTIFKNVAKRHR